MNAKRLMGLFLLFASVLLIGFARQGQTVRAARDGMSQSDVTSPVLFGIVSTGLANSDTNLYRFDLSTGAATLIGPIEPFISDNGIAFSTNDILFHANDFSLSTVDQASGTRTRIAGLDYLQPVFEPHITALDFEPGTSNLFVSVVSRSGAPSFIVTINTTTAEVTTVFLPLSRLDAIAFQSAPSASFDVCLQDGSSGNVLQVNTATGDYQFTNCGGFTLSGIGSIIKKGSTYSLQHNDSDRRVLAKIDKSVNKATASIQVFSQGATFTITDKNILNNTCACK